MVKNKERLETDYLILEIKDEILYATYKPRKITYKDAVNIINERKVYTDREDYPVITKTSKNMVIDKMAREYFRSNEGVEGLSAVAMVQDKTFTQIIINFLLRFYKAPIPMNVFTNEEDAEKWIKSLDL